MNNLSIKPYQKGIALLSVLIAAFFVLSVGGGVTAYQVQQHSRQEKQELVSQIEKLEQQIKATPTPTPTPEEAEPTPSPEPTSTPKPTPSLTVKSATTTAPVVSPSTPPISEPSIPLIVEQEFMHVFGRKPTVDESAFWKERYRKNSADRTKLRSWMQADKDKAKDIESTADELKATPKATPIDTAQSDLLKIERCKNEAQTTYDNFLASGTTALREAANQRLQRLTSMVPIGTSANAGPAYANMVRTIRNRVQNDLDREKANLKIQADSNYNKQYAECLNN